MSDPNPDSKYEPTVVELHDLEIRFTYHAPRPGQAERYAEIRRRARELAERMLEICPASRERSVAFSRLEEAIFWMNASIARNE